MVREEGGDDGKVRIVVDVKQVPTEGSQAEEEF
jgi:hypothetical protein